MISHNPLQKAKKEGRKKTDGNQVIMMGVQPCNTGLREDDYVSGGSSSITQAAEHYSDGLVGVERRTYAAGQIQTDACARDW